MRKTMRILSLLLALLLVVTLLPAGSFAADGQADETAEVPYVFTEEDSALIDNDVFAMITDVEAEEIHPTRGNPPTPDDYAAILPQVIEAVEASDIYVEGSLVRNGDFIWWRASNGMACAFSPYMEAIDHGWQDPERMADEEDLAALDALIEKLESETNTRIGSSPSTKVALIQSFWDNNDSLDGYLDSNFCDTSPKYKSMWETLCETSGCSTDYRYTLANATVDNIAKCLMDCGLVIIDSHGSTDCWTRGTGAGPEEANSSYIEGLADVIMMVHRPEYYHIYQDEHGRDLHGKMEIIVKKNNLKPLGDIILDYHQNTGFICLRKNTIKSASKPISLK